MKRPAQKTSIRKPAAGKLLQSISALLCLLVLVSPAVILGTSAPSNKAGQGDLEEGGNQDITDIELKYNALEQINAIRSHMGLPRFSIASALNNMAKNHSRYMSAGNITSWEENPDDTGFTGVYPLNRAQYCGYDKSCVVEFNGYRKKNYQDFLESCLQDPVLRISLLRPDYTDIGFGKENDYYCIVVGGNDVSSNHKAQLVAYPHAGQKDVRNVGVTSLTKRPQDTPLPAGQIGMPVTLSYFSEGMRELRFENVEVSMTGSKEGQDWGVKISLTLPQNERDLWYSMIIYPSENFRTNTKYTVKARFEVWHQDEFQEIVQEEWSFSSAGSAYIGEVTKLAAAGYLADAVGLPVREDILSAVDEPYQDLLPGELNETDAALAEIVYTLREAGVLDSTALMDRYGYTTREQAVVWLMRILEVYDAPIFNSVVLDYKKTFQDINQCSEDGRPYVQRAYQLGLISDQGGGVFAPQSYITKAEMEELVSVVKERVSIPWPQDGGGPEESGLEAEDSSESQGR